jgi:hypothetical protein
MKIEIPENIIKMAIEMKRLYDDRENKSTAKPTFCVYDKQRVYLGKEGETFSDPVLREHELDERTLYLLNAGGDISEFKSKSAMKRYAKEYGYDPDDYEEHNTQLVSVFEGLFYTKDCAKRWCRQNSHHLNDPVIYVHPSNHESNGPSELEMIYDFLIGIAENVK